MACGRQQWFADDAGAHVQVRKQLSTQTQLIEDLCSEVLEQLSVAVGNLLQDDSLMQVHMRK